ncbi:LysR family transcriptional regulator [uncultured Thiothrix sp.]|uniref:LysR family transcriptional regulator n=1 Tax=uncultured Thiothrix sp. TaxID=223185 RepID=UPI00261530CC|nr:LysR family transcriptional regulator [uncultured Thiothrix sp.]HMT92813.1 LysR family transcriptional regulator [Thiolinea sp.]
MDFDSLQIFVKVVQLGSFTRAADSLNKQKAYVSRSVTQLERALGVRLLERTTRSISLTESGRELYERALDILQAIENVQQTLQSSQFEPQGTLKLSCGIEFGMMVVSHWLSGYLQEYPQMRIEADFTGRLVDIVGEGFDLVIRLGPLNDSSLIARKLGELHYGLFASPHYLAQYPVLQHPQELNQHSLIVFSGEQRYPSHWDLSNGQEQFKLVHQQTSLKINNSFAVGEAAVAGLGIAQLPLLIAKPYVQTQRLIRVLPAWAAAAVEIHAIYPSNRYLNPKVRAFIDYALKHLPKED